MLMDEKSRNSETESEEILCFVQGWKIGVMISMEACRGDLLQ